MDDYDDDSGDLQEGFRGSHLLLEGFQALILSNIFFRNNISISCLLGNAAPPDDDAFLPGSMCFSLSLRWLKDGNYITSSEVKEQQYKDFSTSVLTLQMQDQRSVIVKCVGQNNYGRTYKAGVIHVKKCE